MNETTFKTAIAARNRKKKKKKLIRKLWKRSISPIKFSMPFTTVDNLVREAIEAIFGLKDGSGKGKGMLGGLRRNKNKKPCKDDGKGFGKGKGKGKGKNRD